MSAFFKKNKKFLEFFMVDKSMSLEKKIKETMFPILIQDLRMRGSLPKQKLLYHNFVRTDV